MLENARSDGTLSREIIQIGILVRDVEMAARKLEKLIGIGPFEILEPEYRDMTLHGKVGKYKIKIGLARAGSLQVELMQPLWGETIYDDFANRKGYGLHHLGIRTDSMEESVKEMEARGFKVTQSGNRPGIKFAYLNTEEETDVIFELLAYERQPSPSEGPVPK